ncbi:LysR family transcriptional regulator [Paucilactobacillus oligofermentans DSM 15707 = LMG 22743]|uniref:LysR family transcriptional regulator n=1 Tax=Paucilactobacillus oligofermentans DSM 15707 = LMG 22743 TaxID=1423778 RepID=A0A0R1RCZ0_9LACO|nr:LysR family transcriptional regulator [Paucilactobacillus oligofermentans]KRL54678.1 LysR family transcriptional regulator [Paucilactobacillus oligofermentans DSM 15707 = LMG 22743]CUS26412.1 Transcriptional regulator HypR [Paucilactobacillus oligofermentans DSM 15707 = LMG 22743]
MEIRVLRYFWTIAEANSVSKAAEQLHITQPTLSRQLKELEIELGTELFTREKNRLKLTEAGLFLKSRAEEILSLTQRTAQEFEDRKKDLFSGNIAVGCVEADNSDTLSMMLENFVADYPEVTFNIFTATGDDILDHLDKGLIDLAILLEPVDTEKYNKIVLPRTERWGLLVSKTSFLAEEDVITPKNILGAPLIVSGRPAIRELLDTWVGEQSSQVKVVGNMNLLFNIISLVERQVGSALTIEGATTGRIGAKTKFIPFKPEVKTNCVMVWRKDRVITPAANEFLKQSKHAFKAW